MYKIIRMACFFICITFLFCCISTQSMNGINKNTVETDVNFSDFISNPEEYEQKNASILAEFICFCREEKKPFDRKGYIVIEVTVPGRQTDSGKYFAFAE